MTSTDQPAQGSTVDYCWRWPQEGHSWTWTKHAGLPTVSTRTCFVCRYVDVTEVQDALRRHELDRDRLLGEVASLTAERDRRREELHYAAVALDIERAETDRLRLAELEARAERDAALASLADERERAKAWRERAAALDALLAHYRVGSSPTEKVHRELKRTRVAVDALDAGAATDGSLQQMRASMNAILASEPKVVADARRDMEQARSDYEASIRRRIASLDEPTTER